MMNLIRMVLIACVGVALNVQADEAQIKNSLSQALPAVGLKSVAPSDIKGLYRVETQQGEILFVSDDGQHFLTGDLYTIKGKALENVSEKRRESDRAEKVAAIQPEQKIVFPAIGETKAKISVFTDIDCGYCRKLHKEVPQMNKMGIEVSYLAYPRAGIGSPSYEKFVSAWCSEDKLAALTMAKKGQSIPEKDCDNPVAAQFKLGRSIGISGTPAIVLEDGRLIPGYLSADKLGKTLGVL